MKLSFKNRLSKFLISASVLRLTLIALGAYILIALIFASIYFAVDGVESTDRSHALGALDYIYFSFVTQTTIGYGGMSPTGFGKIIFLLHSIIGIASISIIIGLVVVKLLLPSQSGLRVSKLIVFYPQSRVFRMRFFNIQPIPLEDVAFAVRHRTPVEPDSIILNQYDVRLTRTSAPVLSPHNVWLLDTEPCNVQNDNEEPPYPGAQVARTLTPNDIVEPSSIILQVRGTFYQSKHITTIKFDYDKVRCGQFELIQTTPGIVSYENVDQYIRVSENVCQSCQFRSHCQLDDKWTS